MALTAGARAWGPDSPATPARARKTSAELEILLVLLWATRTSYLCALAFPCSSLRKVDYLSYSVERAFIIIEL